MNFNAFDISASALHAQRTRMDTIASNIANINTTKNPDGTPGVYRRKEAVFASVYNDKVNEGSSGYMAELQDMKNVLSGKIEENEGFASKGVRIMEIAEDYQAPLKRVFNPSHPDSDKEGYVNLPNVNVVNEMVDMMSASRAYEANVTTIRATKSMMNSAMKI